MKFLNNKLVATLVLECLFLFFPVSVSAKDEAIEAGRQRTLWYFLNAHQSPVKWLKVNGVKYTHLLGFTPYHLKIEKLNAIYFVTEEKSNLRFAHFIFLNDGKHYKLQIDPGLGNGIGADKDAYSSEWIERVEWPKIYVLSKIGEHYARYEFNLDTLTWSMEKANVLEMPPKS